MTPPVRETALLLGDRHSLVGVFARPHGQVDRTRPVIVVLNTGIIHRVGHHRMYVTMSRCFAATGYAVLRFDLSGIGDSDPPSSAASPLDAGHNDIRTALDWIETHSGARQAILLGLCSGADLALSYSNLDPRVCGIVLLDPSIPATWRHVLGYVAPRLTRIASWVGLLTFRSRTLQNWLTIALNRIRYGRRIKPSEQTDRVTIEKYFQGAVSRRVSIFVGLTAESTRQTYREQLLDALPNVDFGDLLDLEFLPHSDHLFALESSRRWLTGRILFWLDKVSPQLAQTTPGQDVPI